MASFIAIHCLETKMRSKFFDKLNSRLHHLRTSMCLSDFLYIENRSIENILVIAFMVGRQKEATEDFNISEALENAEHDSRPII